MDFQQKCHTGTTSRPSTDHRARGRRHRRTRPDLDHLCSPNQTPFEVGTLRPGHSRACSSRLRHRREDGERDSEQTGTVVFSSSAGGEAAVGWSFTLVEILTADGALRLLPEPRPSVLLGPWLRIDPDERGARTAGEPIRQVAHRRDCRPRPQFDHHERDVLSVKPALEPGSCARYRSSSAANIRMSAG